MASPSSPDKTKANLSFPKTAPLHFPMQAEMYIPFALAEPMISTSCFPPGRIKAGQALDHMGKETAAGCAASAARCSFLIVYMWAVAYRTVEGQQS